TLSVGIADDALNEGAETLTLVLESPTAAGIDAGHTAAATIAPSDPVTATLSGGGVVVEGAGAARFTVTLSARSAGAIGVPLLFSGSASAAGYGRDYTAPAVVTLPAGALSHGFEVAIVEDSISEGRETLTLTLGALLNPGPGAGPASRAAAAADHSATLDITDNDVLEISIAPPDPATVNEGETAVFTVTAAGALLPVGGITIPYTISGEAEISRNGRGDYTDPAAGRLPVVAASTPHNIAILADGVPDGAEQLTVTLADAPIGVAGAFTVTEDAATITIAASTVNAFRTISLSGPATLAEGGGAQTYTMSSQVAFGVPVTATWRIVHGGTTDADFAAVTGEVTLSSTADFTITAADDSIAEGTEAFAIALSIPDLTFDRGTKIAAPLAASIAASDPVTVTLSGAAEVDEGGVAEVVLAVGGGPAGTGLDVTWSIAPVALASTTGISAGDLAGGNEGGSLRLPADADVTRIRIP
ncbi:MAG: hypothetical protein OXU22_06760, partial [Gammaproteobacteria bacterium]|nr:hypothetical protein [Gammaproteobacteria bacterium]